MNNRRIASLANQHPNIRKAFTVIVAFVLVAGLMLPSAALSVFQQAFAENDEPAAVVEDEEILNDEFGSSSDDSDGARIEGSSSESDGDAEDGILNEDADTDDSSDDGVLANSGNRQDYDSNQSGDIADKQSPSLDEISKDPAGNIESNKEMAIIDGDIEDTDSSGSDIEEAKKSQYLAEFKSGTISLDHLLKLDPDATVCGIAAISGINPLAVEDTAQIDPDYFSAYVSSSVKGTAEAFENIDNLYQSSYIVTNPNSYSEWATDSTGSSYRRPGMVTNDYLNGVDGNDGAFPKVEGYQASSLSYLGAISDDSTSGIGSNGSPIRYLGMVEVTVIDDDGNPITGDYPFISGAANADPTAATVLVDAAHQIRVNYVDEEFSIRYQVILDNGEDAPDGQPRYLPLLDSNDEESEGSASIPSTQYDYRKLTITLTDVFGKDIGYTTVGQKFSTPVTIPQGFYATFWIGDGFGDGLFDDDEQYYPSGDYGRYPLGTEPVWTGPENNIATIDPSKGPSRFSLSEVYTSDRVAGDTTACVVLQRRGVNTYDFDPHFMRNVNSTYDRTWFGNDNTYKDKCFSVQYPTTSIVDDSGVIITQKPDRLIYGDGDNSLYASGGWIDTETGSFNYVWRFRNSNSGDYRFDTFRINGADVNCPMNENTVATTMLPSGAVVTMVFKNVGTNNSEYTITITGAYRDIVLTGLNMMDYVHGANEIASSTFTGVEVERYNATTQDWEPFTPSTIWVYGTGGGYGINDNFDNGYSVPGSPYQENNKGYIIRCKLMDGYQWFNNDIDSTSDEVLDPVTQTPYNVTYSNTNFSAGTSVAPITGNYEYEGWYYVPLPGVGAKITLLNIIAEPIKYEVAYIDGLNFGQALNGGKAYVDETFASTQVSNMPIGETSPTTEGYIIDTNAGNFYVVADSGDYSYMSGSSVIPISNQEPINDTTAIQVPGTFLGWVVTDRNGNAFKYVDGSFVPDGKGGYETTNDSSEYYMIYPNSSYSVNDLNEVAVNLANSEFGANMAICLTALWDPPIIQFEYDIQLQYFDQDGVLQKSGDPLRVFSSTSGNFINVYVNSSSALIRDWLAAHPGYRLAAGNEVLGGQTGFNSNGTFIYRNIQNIKNYPQENPEATPPEWAQLCTAYVTFVYGASITKTQSHNGGEFVDHEIYVRPGDTIEYRIVIDVPPNASAITDATITDKVPEGLIVDEDSIAHNGSYLEDEVIWEDIAVASGDTWEGTFTVKVPASPEQNYWQNIAEYFHPLDTTPSAPDPEPDEDDPLEISMGERIFLPEEYGNPIYSIDGKEVSEDKLVSLLELGRAADDRETITIYSQEVEAYLLEPDQIALPEIQKQYDNWAEDSRFGFLLTYAGYEGEAESPSVTLTVNESDVLNLDLNENNTSIVQIGMGDGVDGIYSDVFGALSFPFGGTYQFTVMEVIPASEPDQESGETDVSDGEEIADDNTAGAGSIVYDTRVYNITFVVTDGREIETAALTMTSDGITEALNYYEDPMIFENYYQSPEPNPGEPTGPGSGSHGTSNKKPTSAPSPGDSNMVKTGDNVPLIPLAIISSLLLVVMASIWRKRRED